ncbi:hypothetical protein H0E87_008640 [Populus deltoides]|uniref:Uncharacterized protein n=1 Tax=Populus deltoides TaxID=3696 RepID=A0A8T2Z1L0_POPDE|nr:hypothetical protein H0E87_008640 [Populus deltoides]
MKRYSKIIGAYDKVASLIFENDAELRDFETSLDSRNGERGREGGREGGMVMCYEMLDAYVSALTDCFYVMVGNLG